MKLDGEQGFCHGTISHKLEPKAFEPDDNDVESIKSGIGIEKEGQIRDFRDSKVYEADDNPSPHWIDGADVWTAPEFDCSMSMDGFTCDDDMSTRGFAEPVASAPSLAKLNELPEFVICYKDSTYHVVKDICIDEGVPSRDKFMFDTDVHEKSVCTVLTPENDSNGEMVKERTNVDVPVPKSFLEKVKLHLHEPDYSKESGPDNDFGLDNGLKDVIVAMKMTDYETDNMGNHEQEEFPDLQKFLPEEEHNDPDAWDYSSEKGYKNNFFLDCGIKDVTLAKEAADKATEKTADGELKEIFSLGDFLSLPEFSTSLSRMRSTVDGADEVERLPLQNPSHNAILATDFESGESENAGEGTLGRPTLGSTAEESHDELLTAAIPSFGPAVGEKVSKAEQSESKMSATHVSEESNNTFEPYSSAPSSSGREECPQDTDLERFGMKNLFRHADPNSSRLQDIPGETSFSATGPFSGSINYSGPIAYSGSLSLRSDSSTTSTRSFAFPVLQSEWNSSPVRMAKADRRLYRKHRGWRHGLLCCRF